MKRTLIVFFLMACTSKGIAQKKIDVDSLVREICTTLKMNPLDTDSLTISYSLYTHLDQYQPQMEEKTWQMLLDKCFLRLQRECPEFKYALDRANPPKDDWKLVYVEPVSKASVKDCADFFKISSFKYLEHNGDSTTVTINDSTWTDHFLDGTFSKLSLTKINDCEFVITFIESNNKTRKNFSKKGDKYRYKIIQKNKTYFDMFTSIPGSPQMQTFRLHY